MLAKLVTRHLRAYRLHVAVIIVMQVCAQIAALSLPTINADIINKGVVTADTGYVTTHSLFMLAIALGQTICQVIAVYLAAQVAMGTGVTFATPSSPAPLVSRPERSTNSEHHHSLPGLPTTSSRCKCWSL